MIGFSGSKGLARIFNKLSLSRDYGEGAMALGAVVMLIAHNLRSDAAFKKACAEMEQKNGKPVTVPQVKPPANPRPGLEVKA
jgi:hypothetical protein